MLSLAVGALSLVATSSASTNYPDKLYSRLMVNIPTSLFKEEGYDHRQALFGMPPYRGSLATNLWYADSDLCAPNFDATQSYPNQGNKGFWTHPFILMVDAGNCTFVKKVRNAQQAGAAGVVIADNMCFCSDIACIATLNDPVCYTSVPTMRDDGSGADVSIPSFLMFKLDADVIKADVKADQPVQLKMEWALPTPDGDRVEYDLWMDPADDISNDFLLNFKDVAAKLGKSAHFTPRMYVYDGTRFHCMGSDGQNRCFNSCTNNGRYCATEGGNGISGADVVKESLRRICVWNQYGEADGIGLKWWAYVNEFTKRCNNADYFMNEACVKDVYKHAKIDVASIDRCMEDSGGLWHDAPNVFLELETYLQNSRGVVVLPAAYVNTAPIRGALTVNNAFAAICAGFASGAAPRICQKCSKCGDPGRCASLGGKCKNGSSGSAGVSIHTFVASMIFVAFAFAGLGFWHCKKALYYTRDQVKGSPSEYLPLEDQEEIDGGARMDFAQAGPLVCIGVTRRSGVCQRTQCARYHISNDTRPSIASTALDHDINVELFS